MISVIIPTADAEKTIGSLIEALEHQTVKPDEIIVVDSESIDNTVKIVQKYKGVRIIEILRKDFDHGRTRDMAFKVSKGEFVIFMTQDALPANSCCIEKLLEPFYKYPQVVLSSARQIPRSDAWRMEKLVRAFNYPENSRVRSKADVKTMGIKAFFSSDVCAAYRRDAYETLGGFEYPVKTNEDMFYAAKAIQNGYQVAYAADALVVHSHNFTLKQQYARNYIQGMEIERHRDILGEVSQESEGIQLVKYVSLELIKHGHFLSFIHFGLDCCARLLGSRAGKNAEQKKQKREI